MKNDLTPQQLKAADGLASGMNVSDTAASVGVTRQTVSLWLNRNDTFAARVGDRRE